MVDCCAGFAWVSEDVLLTKFLVQSKSPEKESYGARSRVSTCSSGISF